MLRDFCERCLILSLAIAWTVLATDCQLVRAADARAAGDTAPILTPKPGPAPHINGPKIYGCRPGKPFLYRIPCTGQRPIAFAAENLPPKLRLDADTGIITGQTPDQPGEYAVRLEARNGHGDSRRSFKIVVGDRLALTPPMGWNDWYTWYRNITDQRMRKAADAMIASGMADFGYQYVNIDDCWMIKPDSDDPALGGAPRDAQGAIRPNGRFPDMKALADYIHSKGLKAGLYTSPGPLTCGKFTGSYQHEAIDAEQFARWGFDFLKYDWCSYGKIATDKSLGEFQRPYRLMGDILKRQDRDIVFNLCQYGMGEVWKWGGEVGGHCWRTTGDLGLAKDTRLPGFYHIGLANAKHAEYAGPGKWNDPDYILIGQIGSPRQQDAPPHATTLTPDEQYSYMSMWCLMAAPLFFSGDMERLDDLTLAVLCNAEVIDIDQDTLGKQARVVRQSEDELILAKPLEDQAVAVGLLNLSETERELSVSLAEVGVTGPRTARDTWRQKDLGAIVDRYSAQVPRHGVALIRLSAK